MWSYHGANFVSHGEKSDNKRGIRRQRPGIIIGGFVGGFALFHFWGPYLEVGLEDMRSENRLLDAIGRDGASGLHLPSAEPPIRYLVGSETLIPLSRNAE